MASICWSLLCCCAVLGEGSFKCLSASMLSVTTPAVVFPRGPGAYMHLKARARSTSLLAYRSMPLRVPANPFPAGGSPLQLLSSCRFPTPFSHGIPRRFAVASLSLWTSQLECTSPTSCTLHSVPELPTPWDPCSSSLAGCGRYPRLQMA